MFEDLRRRKIEFWKTLMQGRILQRTPNNPKPIVPMPRAPAPPRQPILPPLVDKIQIRTSEIRRNLKPRVDQIRGRVNTVLTNIQSRTQVRMQKLRTPAVSNITTPQPQQPISHAARIEMENFERRRKAHEEEMRRIMEREAKGQPGAMAGVGEGGF